MRSTRRVRALFCLSLVVSVSPALPAADAEPGEIPVPPIATALAPQPGVDDLPDRPELPAVLILKDGTPVTHAAQWPQRQAEIRQVLEYYAVGAMPPAPGNVRGTVVETQTVLDGTATYRLIHLTFGPSESLSLDIGIFAPATGGPFPAVIMPAGTPPGVKPLPRLPLGPGQGKGVNALLKVGPDPASGPPPEPPHIPGQEAAERMAERAYPVLARGYAYVVFNYTDCGEDTTLREPDGSWSFRTTRFFPAYPGYDWGLLGAWAWGVSRIVDYLETDSAIDASRLIVSGASRTGKSALVAGAFDARIALTAPVVTGGGGVGAYRFSGAGRGGKEGIGEMMRKYPNWFSPRLHQFRAQPDRLPFDQHWFLALIAPRAFIALEGTTDSVSLANAVRQSWLGAQPAYTLLGVPDRLGVNYADHGHAFTADDWAAMLDFADLHLRGLPVTRRFDQFPPPIPTP